MSVEMTSSLWTCLMSRRRDSTWQCPKRRDGGRHLGGARPAVEAPPPSTWSPPSPTSASSSTYRTRRRWSICASVPRTCSNTEWVSRVLCMWGLFYPLSCRQDISPNILQVHTPFTIGSAFTRSHSHLFGHVTSKKKQFGEHKFR